LRQGFVPLAAVPQTEVRTSHHRDHGRVVFEIP